MMSDNGGLEVLLINGEKKSGVGDFKKAMEYYRISTDRAFREIDDQIESGSTREHLQSVANDMVGQEYEDIKLRTFLADRLAREEARGELTKDQLPARQEELKEEIMQLAGKMSPEEFTDALKANYNPLEVTKENMTPEQRLRTAVMEYEMVSAVNQSKNEGNGEFGTDSFKSLRESMDMRKFDLDSMFHKIDKHKV